jgi:hypothetical protein
MRKLLNAFRRAFGRSASGRRRPRRPARYGPAFEQLETRWLPSGLVGTIVPELTNTYRDVSHEHIYYQNAAAGIQVGDVVLGFIEIETNTTPGGGAITPHSIYAVFSLQVAGFMTARGGTPPFGATGPMTGNNAQNTLIFQPTPAADPHSLQSVLGTVNTAGGPAALPTGTLIALFEQTSGSFGDLVNTIPVGSNSTTAEMPDWIQAIESGNPSGASFDLAVGMVGPVQASNGETANNDFFQTVANANANTFTSSFVNSLSSAVTFASNFGGLTVLLNNTPFNYLTTQLGQDLKLHQFTISQAAESGGNTESNFISWGLRDAARGNGGPNPSPNLNDAGVSDNASFSFFPAAAVTPTIQIVKLTNGTNNDGTPVAGTPDGPLVQFGSTVTWTYDVTAVGSQEPIANVNVTDSVPGVNPQPVLSGGFNVGDTNHNNLLDPDETWVFTASGTAVLGQYSNVGTVTGTSTVTNTPVTASNPDHYFGVDAFIQITPLTPANEVGHAETFTITVTALPGTGQLDPADVTFSTPTITYPGQTPDLSAPTSATFVSRTGNVATYSLTINSDKTGTFEVKASDDITFTSSMSPNSPFTLTRTTGDGFSDANGSDSPDAVKTYVNAFITIAPSATNPVGVPHTFVVQVFADNGDGTGFHQVQDSEPVTETLTAGNGASITQINPGSGTGLASATYNLTTTTAFNPGVTFTSPTAGTVTGHATTTIVVDGVTLTRQTNGVGNNSGDAVKTFANPAIAIVKLTNGTNNDTPPTAGTPDGPLVPVGSTVTWTYDVTNPGAEPIANVAVTDSVPGVNPTPVLSGGFNVGDTNHNNLLDPGETWVFTASGTATLGQYSNVGTVTGTSTVTSTPVTANNPDHYFGVDAFIQITPLAPVNEVTHNGINHSETFTITVTALPGTGPLDPADVAFSTPTISYPLGAPDLAAPTTATFVSRTGNVATYSLTINSNKAGTFEVKASDTVTFTSSMSPNSPLVLTRTTGDTNPGDSLDAVKNYVNALISITPLTASNLVNAPHTFTITVTAFPAGTGAPTFGTPSVSVSPAPNLRNGPVTPLSGPTDNGNGTWTETWTYTINSNRAGTFTAQASDTVTMGGVAVTRTTGDGFTTGNGSDSPNAVKTYVTAASASLSGCVFLDVNNNGVEEATDIRIANVGVTLFKLVGTTWVPVARTFTNAAGNYSFTNLSPGVYRIVADTLPQFLPGKGSLGTVNGRPNGAVVGDIFTNIVLNPGGVGVNFCFALRPTKAMFFARR